MESNSLKYSSIQMVRSIELKFSMYIIRHCPTHCVEFGEFRINSFFTGTQKRILMHYSLRSQIIRSMLVSKRCFRLRLNLICSLQITLAILILVWAGGIVFYRVRKMSCIMIYRLKILAVDSVFTWICTNLICGIYLSLCTVTTGNHVHSIYSSFAGKY